MYWTEITKDYSGLFFRVLGGGSEAFNITQAENTNRLTDVLTSHTVNTYHITTPPTGIHSGIVASGQMGSGGNTVWGLRFIVSAAIRIWKRIH